MKERKLVAIYQLGKSGRKKYSYSSVETGKIVIPLQYDDVGHFIDGFALVCKDGKWGVIDTEGNAVVPLIYDNSSHDWVYHNEIYFANGVIPMLLDGKWGLVNSKGKEVTVFKYDDIRWDAEFFDDLMEVRIGRYNGKYGYVNNKGKEVIPAIYDEIRWHTDYELVYARKDRKYGFVNKQGKTIVPFKYDGVGKYYCDYYDDYHMGFWDGLQLVNVGECDARRYGYIDTAGIEVIPPVYEDARRFRQGLAAVKWNGKWGFIDNKGTVVIPFQYDKANDFWGKGHDIYNQSLSHDEDVAQVEVNDKWIWINRTGAQVTAPRKFEKTGSDFASLVVRDEDGLYGVIEEKTGKTIIPLRHKYCIRDFNNNFIAVSDNGKWGLTDYSGNVIIPLKYDYLHIENDNLFIIELNRKYQFIDIYERALIKQYDSFFNPHGNGIARVELDGKYGFIDRNYIEIIPVIYDDAAKEFSENLICVKLNGKWGYIDKTGKTVLPFQFESAQNFGEGLEAICRNGQWMFIDHSGKTVMSLEKGTGIACCYGGYAFYGGIVELCEIDENGSERFYTINKQGYRTKSNWWPDNLYEDRHWVI
jgi:hypothetical protein